MATSTRKTVVVHRTKDTWEGQSWYIAAAAAEGLGSHFPPPLPFMSTGRSLTSTSRCLNTVLFVFTFAFRAYRHRILLGFRLGGLWNSRFFLFNTERVRALRPSLVLPGRPGLLGGDGEFG